MRSMETIHASILSSIQECDSHLENMKNGFERIRPYLPLKEKEFPISDDVVMAFIDQFLFRFSKLQDSIARRLCPGLFQLIENDISPHPFLDILNRLEKLGAISSVETWQFFRYLRNNLAHDYPESLEQNIANLNTLFTRWTDFSDLYSDLKNTYMKYFPASDTPEKT